MKRAAITYRFENEVGPYSAALRAVGVEPVLVSPAHPIASSDADGLLLSGGTDVNPNLYGQARDPRTEDADDELDSMELRLLREALARDIPVLAICRGLQLLNIAYPGGTLVQHIDGHSIRPPDLSRPAHTVAVDHGTALAHILGASQASVNSRHHQAVLEPGAGLKVSARAEGGVIEGMEVPGRRFAIAVQWHPENQIHASPEQRRLFEAFRDAM